MRIRTIKPEFWSSESNGRLSRDARLVFVGLLNLADDEGRLQGSTRFISSQLFPYDDDGKKVVEQAMVELSREGKAVTYQVNGSTYVQVTGFVDHQKVDKRYPSKLPSIADSSPPIPAECPPIPAECPPGPADSRRMPAETLATNPTPPPTPAEYPPPEWNGMEWNGTGNGKEGKAAGAAPHPLQAVWNEHRVDPLPVWRETTRARKASADLRWRERRDWPEVMKRISASAFCRGQNDRGWKATPDWLLRPDTATKVLEGKYDGVASVKPGAPVAAETQDWSDVVDGQEANL